MFFKFEICLDAIPESPFSRYITGQSLKDAISKVDRTLLRVRGKKVAHIISAEEIDYGTIISEPSTIGMTVSAEPLTADYTYASGYNISTMVNSLTAGYSTVAEVNYSAYADFNTSVLSNLDTSDDAEVNYNVYYIPNSIAQPEQYSHYYNTY